MLHSYGNHIWRNVVSISVIAILMNACGIFGNGLMSVRSTATAGDTAGADGTDEADDADSGVEDPSIESAFPQTQFADSPFITDASAETTQNDLLNGTQCGFDPSLFLQMETNPTCFGPSLSYQNHPDGAPGNAGQLPGGDVGIWLPDHSDGTACGVETFNQRMNGLHYRSRAGMEASAAIICVMTQAGIAWQQTESQDVTDLMNALGIADTNFSDVTFTYDAQANQYAYHLTFTYQGRTLDIDLVHEPGADETQSRGILTYLMVQNEPMCGGGAGTTNNSFVYDQNGEDTSMQVRSAMFCGSLTDGRDDSGVVDPAQAWNKSFNLFTANFQKSTGAGDYSYAWQAGTIDSHARILNVHAEDDGTQVVGGAVFFGYGLPVTQTDGQITGMICNWAGPNNMHNPQNFVQFQSVMRDTNGRFVRDQSLIAYAPVNSCSYNGGGTFLLDRDLDNTLADENAATPLNAQLAGPFDFDLNGTATIAERLQQDGFTVPEAPEAP